MGLTGHFLLFASVRLYAICWCRCNVELFVSCSSKFQEVLWVAMKNVFFYDVGILNYMFCSVHTSDVVFPTLYLVSLWLRWLSWNMCHRKVFSRIVIFDAAGLKYCNFKHLSTQSIIQKIQSSVHSGLYSNSYSSWLESSGTVNHCCFDP